jgi:ATP-dependent DNA helicase RecG
MDLVTVEVEGYLTHGRLRLPCEQHSHDLTQLLARLVDEGFLESDNRGRGTTYRFPGMGDYRADPSGIGTELSGSERSLPHLNEVAESQGLPTEEDPELLRIADPARSAGKASPELTRSTILQLCQGRHLTVQQLGSLLGRNPSGLGDRFIAPMVKEGLLSQLYLHNPSHEQQAYRSTEDA